MTYRGIDVSHNNGYLNWESIQNSGIMFAIIRVGYGDDACNQDDKQAIRNMDECEILGIPYGIYIYSYALTIEHAESEVQHVLRMVKGRNIRLGIWFDMEDADGYKKKKGINVYDNREQLTELCKYFCDRMDQEGYCAGIYANKNYFDNVLIMELLEEYGKWLAHWGIQEPDMECLIWQYSSDGTVPGINGRVDMNYYYGDL